MTDQRLVFESSILGANAKKEVEIPLNNIVSYRHAYTLVVGSILPVKNSFSVFTNQNVSHKFTMFKRDELFQHFKALIPSAELLPDEKYIEGVVGVGGKIVSNFKGAIAGSQGKVNTDNVPTSTHQAVSATLSCPSCDSLNLPTAKFCNSDSKDFFV